MGKCKIKDIQADLGIFMNIPAFSHIISMQKLFKYLVAYSNQLITHHGTNTYISLFMIFNLKIWNLKLMKITSIHSAQLAG